MIKLMIQLILSSTIISLGTFFIFILLAKAVLKIKTQIHKSILFILISSITCSVSAVLYDIYLANNLYQMLFKTLTTIVISGGLFVVIFKQRILISLYLQILYVMIQIPGNLLAHIIMTSLNDSHQISSTIFNLKELIISNIIIYVVSLAIIALIYYFRLISDLSKDIKNHASLSIIVYLILSILMICVCMSFYLHYDTLYNRSTVFGIIVISSLSYLIYGVINTVILSKLKSSADELKYQTFYNKSIEPMIFDLRRFKHDMYNLVNSICGYLAMNDIDGLRKAYSEMYESFKYEMEMMNNLSIFNIKNAGIIGLLINKISQARSKGIVLDVSVVDEINEIQTNIVELCEIIGILIDNAIENCSDKYVKVKISSNDKYIYFIVQNSFINNPNKDRRDNRGMGLKIVQKILDKSPNLLLSSIVDNNIFIQELTISR